MPVVNNLAGLVELLNATDQVRFAGGEVVTDVRLMSDEYIYLREPDKRWPSIWTTNQFLGRQPSGA